MELAIYSSLILIGTFLSSISQALLKKSALISWSTRIKEYLNARVIIAYSLLLFSTILSVFAYRVVPISFGPVLEASGYLWVTIIGVFLFGEKVGIKKALALVLIIGGLIVSALGI